MATKYVSKLCRFLQMDARLLQIIKRRSSNMTRTNNISSPFPLASLSGQSWSAHLSTSVQEVITCDEKDNSSKLQEKTDEKTMSAAEYLKVLDPDMQKKLAVIKLEYDVLSHTSMIRVPEEVTDEMWVEVLNCETPTARRRLYKFFSKNEIYRKNRKKKQEEKALLREENSMPERSERFKNTIFSRISETTMKVFYDSQLSHAMMFGTPLIVDVDYEDHMQKMEISLVVKQLLISHGMNKRSKDPFHIIFCGAPSKCEIMKKLAKHFQELGLEKFLITITEKSYFSLYPRDKLVYLSPHAPDVLENFNFDDVYIIGGFIDKRIRKPVSLAKAKEQKIRCAKLPLDQYLSWAQGNKSLTIDQVLNIMLEMKNTGNWNKALRFVPRRKIVQDENFE